MKKLFFCAVLVGASVLAFWPRAALAGGGGGGGLCAGFASGDTLIMRDSCFEGTAHFASPGGTLVVSNEGSAPHSFTAVDGSFDTGLMQPGETTEIPLDADGIARVYCTLHGTVQGTGMAGVLVVGDPSLAGEAGAAVARDEALVELQSDVTAIREAVASPAFTARPIAATALGALGTALGGAALTVGLSRRRARPAKPQEDSP